MVYETKVRICPYETSDNKCTHKTPVRNKTKRKRHCGYGTHKRCRYYCEWLEARKRSENALNGELETIEVEGE